MRHRHRANPPEAEWPGTHRPLDARFRTPLHRSPVTRPASTDGPSSLTNTPGPPHHQQMGPAPQQMGPIQAGGGGKNSCTPRREAVRRDPATPPGVGGGPGEPLSPADRAALSPRGKPSDIDPAGHPRTDRQGRRHGVAADWRQRSPAPRQWPEPLDGAAALSLLRSRILGSPTAATRSRVRRMLAVLSYCGPSMTAALGGGRWRREAARRGLAMPRRPRLAVLLCIAGGVRTVRAAVAQWAVERDAAARVQVGRRGRSSHGDGVPRRRQVRGDPRVRGEGRD